MDEPVDELLAVLGRERHVLGNLLFRLLEARGLLATGESRFLHLAARDVEAAAEAVREVELTRALLEPLAEGRTLRELAANAPSPLDAILHDHRVAIGKLAAEVGAAMEATTELAEHGLARVRGRQLVAVGSAPRRRPVAPVDDLDREIMAAGYEAVLTASARLMLPSLVAFLG
ncbi:MAG: flagellar protein FlgN [Actinomycetia bacterium]|nr:flagellar protein FlgN [Actinomycetes bacterium]